MKREVCKCYFTMMYCIYFTTNAKILIVDTTGGVTLVFESDHSFGHKVSAIFGTPKLREEEEIRHREPSHGQRAHGFLLSIY